MFRLKIIPDDTSIPFVKLFKLGFVFSIILVLLSIGSFLYQGLNLGIDFKGGILIEAKSKQGNADVENLRSVLGGESYGEVAIQLFGAKDEVLIRIQKQDGDEKAQAKVVQQINALISDNYKVRRTEFVGPTIGAELTQKGIIAVISALAAIMIYIWFRFEWQYSIAAIIALSHDVLTTIGFFALTSFEFNLTTIAAILTISGYSINDTVVVFDRIRENFRRYKSWEQIDIINKSLNETLSRTVMTSVTTALALIAIIIFGGPVLRDFSTAMLWGVLIGTYSSISIAAGLLTFVTISRGGDDNSDVAKAELE
ncbi:protein translocase subunit SecF [Alphaproteobacteria bacterium]|nr:protein translocase subunit SecF [Alphaproteobacteria bacterium]